MKLRYPLNDVLPNIENARDRLLARIFHYRKDTIRSRLTTDEDYALLYAYGRFQAHRDGTTVALQWLTCSSFGHWPALQRDYGGYCGDREVVWHAKRRCSQASVGSKSKDGSPLKKEKIRSERLSVGHEDLGSYCREKEKTVEESPCILLACSTRKSAGGRSLVCSALGLAGREQRPSIVRPSTTDASIAVSPSIFFLPSPVSLTAPRLLSLMKVW